MPRRTKKNALKDLADTVAGLIEDALEALTPPPEPIRIPVRTRDPRR